MNPANGKDINWVYPFKKKILFGSIGLLVLSVAGSMVFVITTLRGSLLRSSTVKTQELGEVIQSSLRSMMMKRDPHAMQETFDNIKRGNSALLKAFIVDKNGRIAFSTERAEIGTILDRNSEESCRGCHQQRGISPKETTSLIAAAGGIKAQRNIRVIYNEEACLGCHAKSDRINGKLIIDRSLRDTYSVIMKTQVLILGAGIFGLVLLIPFLSGRINKYILEIVDKHGDLILLLTIAERLSRTIEIRELRLFVADIVRDSFEADTVDFVHPREDNECRVYRWCRGKEGLERRKIEEDERLRPVVDEWVSKELVKAKISDDGKHIYVPIRKGDTDLALIALGRLEGPFAGQKLKLVSVISNFMSMAFDNARLYSIAITDELTQLFTKRHFRYCIDGEYSQFEKYGQKFTLLMLDVDNFKHVNDTYGHMAGDSVLKGVGQAILQSIRDNDLAFRYGGEEFVVLLPSTDTSGGIRVAERIRGTIEASVFEKGTHDLRVTMSIGVAVCPDNADTVRGLILSADGALYRAKEAGKNRVAVSENVLPRVAGGR